jgi:hypothetical protein
MLNPKKRLLLGIIIALSTLSIILIISNTRLIINNSELNNSNIELDSINNYYESSIMSVEEYEESKKKTN